MGNTLPPISLGEGGLHAVDSYSTPLERHRDMLEMFFKEIKMYSDVESS